MMKTVIVEDNAAAAQTLRGQLEAYGRESGEEFDVTLFSTAEAFLADYAPVVDLVLLDIELPGMDGMEAARRLREKDDQVLLVFVTNMQQFAVRGYEVQAADYLVKPLRYEVLRPKLARLVRLCRERAEALLIPQPAGARRLLVRDVAYVEVQGHSLVYHTPSGLVTCSGTLNEAESRLRPLGFLRCNQCYLVNHRHIAIVDGLTLRMDQGDTLLISRPRKKRFMTELAECMGSGRLL